MSLFSAVGFLQTEETKLFGDMLEKNILRYIIFAYMKISSAIKILMTFNHIFYFADVIQLYKIADFR